MSAGRPIVANVRSLTRIAAAGGAVLIAGEMLVIIAALGLRAPFGWLAGLPAAAALIVTGLLCGAVVVALALATPARPRTRGKAGRRRARPPAARAVNRVSPEEWLSAILSAGPVAGRPRAPVHGGPDQAGPDGAAGGDAAARPRP